MYHKFVKMQWPLKIVTNNTAVCEIITFGELQKIKNKYKIVCSFMNFCKFKSIRFLIKLHDLV